MRLFFDIYEGIDNNINIVDNTPREKTNEREAEYYPDNYLGTYNKLNKFKYIDTATINYLIYPRDKNKTIAPVITNHVDDSNTAMNFDEEHIPIKNDGYYIVYHFILPTSTWIKNITESYEKNLPSIYENSPYLYVIYYDENTKEASLCKYDTKQRTYTDACICDLVEGVNKKEIGDAEAVSYETKSIFVLGNLKNCYIGLSQKVFDSKMTICCNNKNKEISQLTFNRDFVGMTLKVIEYYVESDHFDEAQTVLDKVNYCGGFCKNISVNTINSYEYPINDCGCNK